MNKQHQEAQARLTAELAKAGIKQPADSVAVSCPTTEFRDKKRILFGSSSQPMTREFIEWCIRAESQAATLGIDTKDKVLKFEEVNASEVAPIKGYTIVPKRNEAGDIVGVDWIESEIKVPVYSPLYDILKSGKAKACRITGDSALKASVYKHAAASLFRASGKYLMGNLKSEETILAVVDRAQATKLLGSDLGIYENPFKPWLAAFGTPSRLIYKGSGDVIRIRIIDDLKTKYGHKYHDGTLISRFDVVYQTYGKRKEGQTDAEYDATRKTMVVKSSHQDRIFGEHNGVMYPAVKCKGYNDRVKYFQLCMEFGFDPYETDAIMCLGNLKTKNHNFKHGDIFNVPAEIFRIIGVSSKSGKSSVGAQAMCLDLQMIQRLFLEKGMDERAVRFKKAACGDARALEEILQGQEEHSTFEDVTIMWIINMMFALERENGKFEWPRFESNYNNVCVRLNRYFIDNVLKCRLSGVALYLEVNPMLDDLEFKHWQTTGKHVNLVMLPKKGKIRKMMVGKPSDGKAPQFKYLNIGRNPIVSQGNLQGVILLRNERGHVIYNDSHDTIEISAAFAHEMFGDQDGDKVIFAPSNEAHFPVCRSVLPEETKKAKSAPVEVNDTELAVGIINAAIFILEAAMDTGILDLTRRQIYIEAWLKGKPVTPQEGKEIGDICENAIQRIKHVKAKGASGIEAGADTIKDQLIRRYARGGMIMDPEMAPKEFTITKRHADRRFDTERIVLDRKLEIINTARFHRDFPFNVAFDEIKGAQMSVVHTDSERLRQMFDEKWVEARGIIVRNQKSMEDNRFTFTIRDIELEGKLMDEFYRNKSKDALRLEDEARAKAFRNIRTSLRWHLTRLQEKYKGRGPGGKDAERFVRFLTLFLGTISFGTMIRNGATASRSGLALRAFPEELLIWAARYVNPKNPWCSAEGSARAEKMIEQVRSQKKSSAAESSDEE